jgi:hypothetical protein
VQITRIFTIAASSVLGLASLLVADTAVSSASPMTRPDARPAVVSPGPNPDAPHVGAVAGARYGAGIAIRATSVVDGFRAVHEAMGVRFPPRVTPDTIHETIGTSFDAPSGLIGSQASQSVSTSIVASSGTTLYMPTMYPLGGTTGGSCIEVTTVYTPSADYVGAWDWCHAINFEAQVTINASFISTYTESGKYSVQIVRTAASTNTWTAYLYDYATSAWNELYQQSGSGQTGLTDGWDIFELYTTVSSGQSKACGDLAGKTVASSSIELEVGSTWKLAGTGNAGEKYNDPVAAFKCTGLSFHMVKKFSSWKVVDAATS